MSVSGWSGPSLAACSLSVSSSSAIASAVRPAACRPGEVAAAEERVGVVGAELRRPQLERLLVHRDRLGRPTRVHVGHGEIVAAGERVGVVGAELRLQRASTAFSDEDLDRLAESAEMVQIVPRQGCSLAVRGPRRSRGPSAALDLQCGSRTCRLGLANRPQVKVGRPSVRGVRPRPRGWSLEPPPTLSAARSSTSSERQHPRRSCFAGSAWARMSS